MAGLTKWIIGLLSVWVLFTLIASVCELAYVDTAGMSSKFGVLLHPTFTIGGIKELVGTFWSMFWWDYPFLKDGIFVFLRYLGLAISFGIAFVLVIEIVQIAANALGRIFGVAR